VRKIKKLPVQHEAYFPSFGRSKHEILITGRQFNGLSLYNSRSRRETSITDETNAGEEHFIDKYGSIIFKVESDIEGEKISEYKTYDPKSKNITAYELIPEDRLKAKINGKKIEICSGEQLIQTLAPAGDKYYIWASIAPDNKRILFTAVGDGTYISDMDGNILANLGVLNAPVWMNNDWVLGMHDSDDGHVLISSDVVTVNIPSGKRFNLTAISEEIAIYPKVSPDNAKIVFHSPKGEIFSIKIKLRK